MSKFVARTTESGIYGNAFWYTRRINPGAYNGIWLPNCTTYAYGRSAEIAARGGGSVDYNTIFGGGFGNAAGWYAASLWDTSPGMSKVLLGDILCWEIGGGVGSAGHVAVVEGIEPGKIWLSESHDTPLSQTYSYPGQNSRRYFEYGYLDTATMVIHVTYYYNPNGTYDTHYGTIGVPNLLGTIHNPFAPQDNLIKILVGYNLRRKKGGRIIVRL